MALLSELAVTEREFVMASRLIASKLSFNSAILKTSIDYQGAHFMDVFELLEAKSTIERYLQDASLKEKRAWKVIVAALDPLLKIKRRGKTG